MNVKINEMNKAIQIGLIIGAILFLFNRKNKSEIIASNDHIELYDFFIPDINKITNYYNTTLSLSQILAMLRMESGFLYKHKTNDKILGDDGYSIGFTQVTRYALADVNYKYNLQYTFTDLYNKNVNLTVGILYLQLCYNSALYQGAVNPVYTAFKKYNGGIDETENSYNPMASNYGDKALQHFYQFNNIFIT